MTLFGLLPAFQEAPLPAIPKEGGWVLSAVMLIVLFWREFTKSRAERDATMVTGYKDMLDRQTATVRTADATIIQLTAEVGRLRDEVTAQKVNAANLRGEAKYLRKELRKANGEDESDEPDGPDEPTAEEPCRPAS